VLKRRHVYVLLFAVPALLVSSITAVSVGALCAAVLWLFVFGDNPWPPIANTLLGVVLILVGAALWIAFLALAWAVGKQQEDWPALNRAHVAVAIGVTAVLALVIAVRLTGQDIVGTPSDSQVCADLCRAKGFAGSGTPPLNSGDRTCSCYDARGGEAERIDLAASPAGGR